MGNGSWKAHWKADWTKTKGCVEYNGHTKLIGAYKHVWHVDSVTGKYTKEMECGKSDECTGMVRIGEDVLVFYEKALWKYSLPNNTWTKLSEDDWSKTSGVVEYNSHAYVFYTNGIWKTDINGKYELINNDNWGKICRNSVVNFGRHCYCHQGKNIYHVD